MALTPIGTLSIDDGGTGGLPVIFVHSLAGNAAQWSAQLDHLRRSRRAVAVNLRGHGLSEPPADGNYSIESLAGDIDTIVRRIGMTRFVLVGHSMGGIVALAYADANPGQVAGILLADPAGDIRNVPEDQIRPFMNAIESGSYAEAIEDWWNHLLAGSDEAVRSDVMQDLRDTPQETVVGIFKSSMQYDPLPALSRYGGPILSIITPFNDAPFSLHHLHPALPHKRISGTGHWLQMDKPREFNRLLDEFLLTVQQADRSK
ncbi:MAG TPA: alpha/beta hydrolase [Syntrophales bacterium]|nr:alpha/beta hydrolase [Syntrophales bacterium]